MKSFKMICLGLWIVICALMLGGVAMAETADTMPEIYLKAINPGYTVDGKSNVGEMIEIGRKNSDSRILLAGLTVRYTNSSGKETVLYEFPEDSYMVGETILLRLASSPNSELANASYSKTIAMSASLAIMRGEDVVDDVCWTGKKGCYKSFVSAKPTTLVRNMEAGDFEHLEDYVPGYDEKNYVVESSSDDEVVTPPSQCKTMIFSEILSYYETSKAEQFIELYNSGAEQVLLDGCKLKYKNKMYDVSGIVKPEEYYVYYPTEFSLTKNPTNLNTLELIDANGQVVDKLDYPNGQRKGTAYAMIGYDEKGEEIWKVTYAPTPRAGNNYQEYRTCEEGKVINEATGNCVKVTAVTEKICREGYYLNLLTGRCKKYESASEKKCKEGYYLNPETGRCRKVVENKGAEYSIEPEKFEEKSSFVALYAVIGVILLGLVYLGYEFRHQITKAWVKVIKR